MANIVKFSFSPTRLTRYRNWLMDIVDLTDDYSDLCDTLLSIEFEYSVGNDCDRAEDGLELRREFEELVRAKCSDNTPCTMLEMLVAVSSRAAELMYEGDEGESPGYYFWIFIVNLGLNRCHNREDFRRQQRKIVDVCATYMSRSDENVDIVVVNHPPRKWAKMEIWKKINWFLTENYYKNG